MDLPYKPKFESLPDIDPEQLVEYFNLELGVVGTPEPFSVSDFEYLGVHIVNGIETMLWSVEGCDVCAAVKPFEDSYIVEMDKWPS